MPDATVKALRWLQMRFAHWQSRKVKAAQETSHLITAAGDKIAEGKANVESTAELLGEIVTKFERVDGVTERIADASSSQASALKEIEIGATQVENVTQQNAASAEETSAVANIIAKRSKQLQDNLPASAPKAPLSRNDYDLSH